jgi:hypothetical protein
MYMKAHPTFGQLEIKDTALHSKEMEENLSS